MERIPLTPGRLYKRLSAEFEMLRPASCSSCHMPLPEIVQADDDDANWTVGAIPSVCEECRPVAEGVARRASFFYDVHDPATHGMRGTRFDRTQ